MHFLHKTIGFLALFAALPAAYGVTARPGVVTAASRRMPTMTAVINTSGGTTSSTTSSNLLDNKECIDTYTDCMKEGDVCGPNFEECTTKVLFHGKMAQCLSTLGQCSAAGVNSLFGTSAINALSNVASKNNYGEVTDYTYPTDGSVLGQLIIGAAISNRYDTSTCVKRYTSCLKKESVCGNDFELCTTDKEFKKQRVYCDSTLARCQSEGLIELLGSASATASPSKTSRVGELIEEGASLAAVNAVATCYKVADQCIIGACSENPYKCYENSNQTLVKLVEAINSGDLSNVKVENTTDTVAKSAVSAYIKNSCLDTIGSNKYCYATFLGNGVMPTASQLKDEDNQEEIYDAAINARLNASMKAKLKDLIDKFDTKAKQKCTETIRTCAMRTCGSGSGAACYAQVFGNNVKSINNKVSYNEIKIGCAAVVNTDQYCQYAAVNPNATGTYSYSYINNDAFDILFPAKEESDNDPIGVIAALNASLASNYSEAAIAQMKRQCQTVATSCVKTMCGTDYQNCYRNRTDVYSDLTNTGQTSFDKSMNKVGGVLDYTIVLGLCLNTVQNSKVCEEHLAIERNRVKINYQSSSAAWGDSESVRDGWIDAGSATSLERTGVAAVDANGSELCTTAGGSDQRPCYTVDAAGNVYDTPVYVSMDSYVQSQAASSLFKDLIYDLEKEAQAKYNAKLTKQQNMCLSGNDGGIIGNRDLGSTFAWVKLKSPTVPKGYAVSGLKQNQFMASNDIYGSFCRVRVTLQSDDKKIQDVIANGADWSVAYFAAGDAFTCGSWIPGSALEAMAKAVGKQAREEASAGNGRTRTWATLIGTLGGGALGGIATNKMQEGKFLGGLLGTSNSVSAGDFGEQMGACYGAADSYVTAQNVNNKTTYLNRAATAVRKLQSVDKDMFDKKTSIKSLSDPNENIFEKDDDMRQVMLTQLNKAISAHQAYVSSVDAYNAGSKDTAKATSGSLPAFTSDVKLTEEQIKSHLAGRQTYSSHTESVSCMFKCTEFEGAENGDRGESYTGNYPGACAGRYKNDEPWVTTTDNKACTSTDTDAVNSRQNVKYTYTVYYTDEDAVTYNKNIDTRSTDQNDKLKKANDAMRDLGMLCNSTSASSESLKKADRKKAVTNLIGTGVGAVAGGVLAYQITKSVQDAKLDKVEKAAYDEWMNDVGNHLNCYIGKDQAGVYGDVVSTSME